MHRSPTPSRLTTSHLIDQSHGIDQSHSIAELLSASLSPAAVTGILDAHVADPTGHCRGCRFPTTASPVWPCRLWGIADEARRLHPNGRRPH
jgi:hypothetical protein